MNGVQICLTKEQVDRINAWIGETPFAHYKEESIPPGFDLVVSFAGPFGAYAVAREAARVKVVVA